MANHNELGKKGEELATAFLLKNGYDIITRNYVYQIFSRAYIKA